MAKKIELSAEMLEAILLNASEGIVIADNKGKFILWNNAAEKIVGMPPKNIDPKEYPATYGCYKDENCIQLYESDELPLFRAIRGDVFTNAEMFIKNESKHNTAILLSGRPILDDEGNKKGCVLMFRDVTDLFIAKKTENYYKSFYNSVPIAFFTSSIKDGTFVRANPYCVHMLGFDTFEEMAKKIKATDLYLDLDDRKKLIKEIQTNEKVSGKEIQLKLLNGEIKWVEVTASLCKCGKFPMCQMGCGFCFEGVLFDITKKKRMEKELIQVRKDRMKTMRDINTAIEEKLKAYHKK